MRNYALHRKTGHYKMLRPGTAPVEFVLFLPIFVCFLAVIIWIARANNAAIQASLDAEAEVIKEAVLVVEQGRLPSSGNYDLATSPELTKLVHGFDPTAIMFGGRVDGFGERDTGEGVGKLISAAGSAQDQQQALAHAWESELFSFPLTRSEQPPLRLPKSVRGIAAQTTDFSAFSGLLSFSGRNNPSASNLVGVTQSKLDNSLPKVDAAVAQLKREIDDLEQRNGELQRQQQSDLSLISALKKDLAFKKGQLKKLTKGRANGQSAGGFLSSDTLPAESVD